MAVLSPEQESSVRTQFAPTGGQAADARPAAAEGKVELPPTLSVKELAEYAHARGIDAARSTLIGTTQAHRTLAAALGAVYVEVHDDYRPAE